MVPAPRGAGLVTVGAGAIVRRKVGGINGDQLGAANQLVELSVLLSGVVVFAPAHAPGRSPPAGSVQARRLVAARFLLQEALDLRGELVARGRRRRRRSSPDAPGTLVRRRLRPPPRRVAVVGRAPRRAGLPAEGRSRRGGRAAPAGRSHPPRTSHRRSAAPARRTPRSGCPNGPSPSRAPTAQRRAPGAGPAVLVPHRRAGGHRPTRCRTRARPACGARQPGSPRGSPTARPPTARRLRSPVPRALATGSRVGAVEHEQVASGLGAPHDRDLGPRQVRQRAVDHIEHRPARAVVEQRVGVARRDRLAPVRELLRRRRCRPPGSIQPSKAPIMTGARKAGMSSRRRRSMRQG